MLTNHKPKGVTPTNTLLGASLMDVWRQVIENSVISNTAMRCGALVLLVTQHAWADTAYRCGDAYSPYAQCANGPAAAIQPTAELRNAGQDKDNASSDLREAQALEKQRLQAERQAAETAPVRFSAPLAPPASVAHHAPQPQKGKGKGQRKGKAPSPYFTAVDPNAAAQKKSTAKAVPEKPSSRP
jgi:hypothetical protein